MMRRLTCSSEMPMTFAPSSLELRVPTPYTCEACRYWLEYKGEGEGRCRRYPPFDGGFPQTTANTWCGEWKSKEAE